MHLDFVEHIPQDTDSIVFLLHGYGADKNDLFGLSPYFAHALPHTAFISPDAVFPCDMGFGRQWFGIDTSDMDRVSPAKTLPPHVLEGANTAHPYLVDFIRTHMHRLHIPAHKVALLGFSQGAMMALHTGLRWDTPFAGIVGCSGMLIGTDILADEITVRPPVVLIHGEQDTIVDVGFMNMASECLVQNGVDVDTLLCPNLGHEIDEQGLLTATRFLQKSLKNC